MWSVEIGQRFFRLMMKADIIILSSSTNLGLIILLLAIVEHQLHLPIYEVENLGICQAQYPFEHIKWVFPISKNFLIFSQLQLKVLSFVVQLPCKEIVIVKTQLVGIQIFQVILVISIIIRVCR